MQVTVTSFNYRPGNKWDCGLLEFTATSDLGEFRYREVIPGHRHSDDHRETRLTLNGQELNDDNLDGCELPDFEPPRREGRWSALFEETGREDVAENLGAWLDAVKDTPAFRTA